MTKNEKTNQTFCKLIKPINNFYNLCQFGVSVLSASKRIMNKLICLAWWEKIPVYYQDTDSIHILAEDLPRLEKTFNEKYKATLVGTELCQFHSDFSPVKGKPSYSRKLIAVGKKSYLDILRNEDGDEDYHFRLKGIPQNVILNYCSNNHITLEQLYTKLYNGETIEFNLLDGSTCFRKDKTFAQYTPTIFNRKIKF
jgi:hypothetical protein